MLAECEVLRFSQYGGDFVVLKDNVAVEETINLYINGTFHNRFHCTPLQIKELAIGHLLTEGIIKGVKEVAEIKSSGNNIYVDLTAERTSEALGKISMPIDLHEEHGIPTWILKAAQKLKFNEAKFSVEIIFKSVETLESKALIFRASGGTHAAVMLDESGTVTAFAEDIGRHNAIDKAIGEAAIKGADLSKLLLAFTGRPTSEIITKVTEMGIPVLVSLSAPTSMSVKMAETTGLTLIRFTKEKSLKIYASPYRIKEWAAQRSLKTQNEEYSAQL